MATQDELLARFLQLQREEAGLRADLSSTRAYLKTADPQKERGKILEIARATSEWDHWYLACEKLTGKQHVREILDQLDDLEVLRNAVRIRESSDYKRTNRLPYIDEYNRLDESTATYHARARIKALGG